MLAVNKPHSYSSSDSLDTDIVSGQKRHGKHHEFQNFPQGRMPPGTPPPQLAPPFKIPRSATDQVYKHINSHPSPAVTITDSINRSEMILSELSEVIKFLIRSPFEAELDGCGDWAAHISQV